MQKAWKIKVSKTKGDVFAGLKDVATAILKNRGVKTREEIEEIFLPEYVRHLHDPFLLKDMEKGVARILQAIENEEKILIFGDYDADGVPASAVLAEFFRKINYENFSVYIPHRHNEQYGLSVVAVEKFKADGVQLIITVDCGISNLVEVKRANELGIDVVVTDHHLPPAKLPKAVAVIDPKRTDCAYPYKHLAGTGVAFKLVQALIARGNLETIPIGWEKWLLELVAIATVADMVPMTGENKTMTKFGLMVLRMTHRLGLLELFRVLKLKREYINEEDIGFMIGPRINSAGRMSHALEAFNLLMTTKEEEARQIACDLEGRNKERRSQVTEILDTVEKHYQTKNLPAVLVVGNEDWGLGVLGLAAARISEKYGRTVFVWAKNGNGEIKGSCRSDGKVNVVELMTLAGKPKFFRDFGGHAFAGGFSLPAENLVKLEKKLLEAYKKMTKTVVVEEEEADLKISLADIGWAMQKEIEKIGPYGLDFPKPVFWLENLAIVSAKAFGKTGGHVEIVFKDNEDNKISAIAFFACDSGCDLSYDSGHIWPGVNLAPGRRVDMLANIEKSTFKNRPELRLRVVDLRQA
ncbi:MAG: single-stranded-DNA-specific exonuclease RecJ [Candidatus Vogelbacteria bacterium RIFOXYD1_FULL_44_32]|uniref:Single-stranded-DNA-specific exonuclease RecJ n=1 Tax=Candidatus Vogelbacteria bacterium RIFOXYD1_FULL_44_32 TaxID=1802438 RepID=A0A1G2QFT6_9BACT|nr:MAG: single-stranded-DNA-specific exonuclease RecJ [Candidatus Vogelbacteria bacterium RIFOXYD1_FULL_44_32]